MACKLWPLFQQPMSARPERPTVHGLRSRPHLIESIITRKTKTALAYTNTPMHDMSPQARGARLQEVFRELEARLTWNPTKTENRGIHTATFDYFVGANKDKANRKEIKSAQVKWSGTWEVSWQNIHVDRFDELGLVMYSPRRLCFWSFLKNDLPPLLKLSKQGKRPGHQISLRADRKTNANIDAAVGDLLSKLPPPLHEYHFRHVQ
jgi:hypothetical protein